MGKDSTIENEKEVKEITKTEGTANTVEEVTDVTEQEQEENEKDTNSDEVETEKKKMPPTGVEPKQLKQFGIACIVCAILIAFVSILLTHKEVKLTKNGLKDVVLSGDAVDVDDGIENVINKNAYVEAQIGPQDYVYFLYNKKGEVIIESSGGVEFVKDNHEAIIVGDDNISVINGADPVYEMKYANSLFGCTTDTDSETGNKTYTITVEGEENIRKLYDNFGDGYSDGIVKTLVEALNGSNGDEEDTTDTEQSETEQSEETTVESTDSTGSTTLPSDTKIIFQLVLKDVTVEDKENQDVFVATKKIVINSSTEYYDWYISGYYAMGDWELPSDWYGDVKSKPVADVQSAAEKVLKRMDINMLNLMGGLKDVVDGLQTADTKLTEYYKMSEDKQTQTIELAIEDLNKCQYLVDAETSDIKEQIDSLKDDEDFSDIDVMLATLYVCDKNQWLSVDESASYSEEAPQEDTSSEN